jgi:phage regulator Rha-like protein
MLKNLICQKSIQLNKTMSNFNVFRFFERSKDYYSDKLSNDVKVFHKNKNSLILLIIVFQLDILLFY